MLPFLIYLLLPFFSFGTTIGAQRAFEVHDLTSVAMSSGSNDGMTLSDLLSGTIREISRTYEKVKTMPACQKMASAALLHSCTGLEESHGSNDDDEGNDGILEETKVIFAARYAVCELGRIKEAVPAPCAPFTPTKRTGRKQGFRGYFTANGATQPIAHYREYEHTTAQHLDQCLTALHLSGTGWTSYSNAKRSAVAMCGAARVEAERDETLHMFKVMTELNFNTTISTTQEFQTFLRDLNLFRQDWVSVRKDMMEVHMDLVKGMDDVHSQVLRRWAGLNDHVQKLGQDINRIRGDARDVTANLREHRAEGKAAHDERMRQMNELGIQQKELAVAVVDTVQEGIFGQIVGISSALAYTQNSTLDLNQQLRLIFAEIDEHANRTREALHEVQMNANNLTTLSGALFGISDGVVEHAVHHATQAMRSFLAFLFAAPFAYACLDRWGPFNPKGTAMAALSAGAFLTSSVSSMDMQSLRATADNTFEKVADVVLQPDMLIAVGFLVTLAVLAVCVKRTIASRTRAYDTTSFSDGLPAHRLRINDPRFWQEKKVQL